MAQGTGLNKSTVYRDITELEAAKIYLVVKHSSGGWSKKSTYQDLFGLAAKRHGVWDKATKSFVREDDCADATVVSEEQLRPRNSNYRKNSCAHATGNSTIQTRVPLESEAIERERADARPRGAVDSLSQCGFEKRKDYDMEPSLVPVVPSSATASRPPAERSFPSRSHSPAEELPPPMVLDEDKEEDWDDFRFSLWGDDPDDSDLALEELVDQAGFIDPRATERSFRRFFDQVRDQPYLGEKDALFRLRNWFRIGKDKGSFDPRIAHRKVKG
jgi:hypothetical protein